MQKLILPVNNCVLDAGYKNAAYRKLHGYNHWGLDLKRNYTFDVIASGSGTVAFAGLERGDLGYVVGIVYNDAYRGKPVVVRYYHMCTLSARQGQTVKSGDVIGSCIGVMDDPQNRYPGRHHVHIECDTDYRWAQYSPQVGNGCRYLRKSPVWGQRTCISPTAVLNIGTGQSIIGNPTDTYYSQSDLAFGRA